MKDDDVRNLPHKVDGRKKKKEEGRMRRRRRRRKEGRRNKLKRSGVKEKENNIKGETGNQD